MGKQNYLIVKYDRIGWQYQYVFLTGDFENKLLREI